MKNQEDRAYVSGDPAVQPPLREPLVRRVRRAQGLGARCLVARSSPAAYCLGGGQVHSPEPLFVHLYSSENRTTHRVV